MTKVLVSLAAACAAAAAIAGLVLAYFGTPETAGGGLAAAATVAAGTAPQAVLTGGRQVTLAWAESRLSSGRTVDGYRVVRYSVLPRAAVPASSACAGTVTETHCVESNVPPGTWVWTVTPVVGTNWRGAESGDGNAVTVDPPSLSVDSEVFNLASFAGGTAEITGHVTGFAANEQLSMGLDDLDSGPMVAVVPAGVDRTGRADIDARLPRAADGRHVLLAFGEPSQLRSEAGVPITIDTVAPVTTAEADASWHRDPVTVHLHALDPLPETGVKEISFNVGGGPNDVAAGPDADVLVPAPQDGSNDGVRVIEFSATDVAGNVEGPRQASVKIDTTAPTTELTTSPPSPDGDNSWFRHATVPVSLDARDAASGVASTSYSIDGGAVLTYGGVFAVQGEGRHTIVYSSIDRAGNQEAQRTAEVDLDNIDPATQVALGPAAPDGAHGWYRSTPSFTVAASDDASGVAASYYILDGGPTNVYRDSVTLAPDGTHALDYWSRDNAGNVATAQTASVRVDTVAPLTTIAMTPTDADGTNGWYRSTVHFTLNATDATSGVDQTLYSIDDGPAKAYGGPVTVPDGRHTVHYWSVDEAGNAEAQHATGEIKVDTVQPDATSSVSPSTPNGTNGWYRGADPTVALSAADLTSGVAGLFFRIDAGASAAYGGRIGIPEGVHTVSFWAVDNAGNVEDVRTTAPVDVDTVSPTVALALAPSPTGAFLSGTTLYYKNAANGSFRLVATAVDATSGPASTLYPAMTATSWTHAAETVTSPAGGPYQSGTFQFLGGAQPPGAYAATVTDGAGNSSTVTFGFVNDVTAPIGQSILYPGGFITTPAVPLTLSNGTDAGSGIGQRLVQRSSGTLSNGLCASATFVTILTNPPASVVDTTVPSNTCNIYGYVESDNLGNTSNSVNGGLVAKVDATAPTIAGLQLKNNGPTPGRIEQGDQIVVGYSDEGMKVNMFCSGWISDNANQTLNADNQVSVTVDDGGGSSDDSISVSTSSGCNGGFNLGSIDLGASTYVTGGSASFGGSLTNRSTIAYNATAHTVTITLGAQSGTGALGTVTSSAATYAPSPAIADSAGNAVKGSFTTDAVPQF